MTTPEQMDLARGLPALAATLQDAVVPDLHRYSQGLITDWATADRAEALAVLLETAAMHIRACAPHRPEPTDIPMEDTCDSTPARPGSTWRPARPVSAAGSPTTARTTVGLVAGLAKSSDDDESCPHCGGVGELRWQQPTPDGNGGMVLRDMTHPCPAGCGPEWKHPAAERGRVVDGLGQAPPERVQGNAAACQRIGADFIGAFVGLAKLAADQERDR